MPPRASESTIQALPKTGLKSKVHFVPRSHHPDKQLAAMS